MNRYGKKIKSSTSYWILRAPVTERGLLDTAGSNLDLLEGFPSYPIDTAGSIKGVTTLYYGQIAEIYILRYILLKQRYDQEWSQD